jgi:RNA polymerase sigma-70 factor (ECF subfamily)
VAVNLCKNRRRWFLRREKTYSLSNPETLKKIDIPSSNLSPECILERKEIELHIQRGINSLPLKYRILIILRDIQGLSYKEIARIIKSSEVKVKSRLYRARKILQKKLIPLIMEERDEV